VNGNLRRCGGELGNEGWVADKAAGEAAVLPDQALLTGGLLTVPENGYQPGFLSPLQRRAYLPVNGAVVCVGGVDVVEEHFALAAANHIHAGHVLAAEVEGLDDAPPRAEQLAGQPHGIALQPPAADSADYRAVMAHRHLGAGGTGSGAAFIENSRHHDVFPICQ